MQQRDQHSRLRLRGDLAELRRARERSIARLSEIQARPILTRPIPGETYSGHVAILVMHLRTVREVAPSAIADSDPAARPFLIAALRLWWGRISAAMQALRDGERLHPSAWGPIDQEWLALTESGAEWIQ